MSVKEEKSALRQKMLAARAQIKASQKASYDASICHALQKIIEQHDYKRVHAYIPMAHEIDIAPLLQHLLHNNISVVCPKTLPKRALENRILQSLHDLETGIKGTQHPANAALYEGHYDLIIVPGLAFDLQNYRLGYGGGYYDNFLMAHPQAHKIGIFYPFQLVAAVPREAHDVCLDSIIANEFEAWMNDMLFIRWKAEDLYKKVQKKA